MVHRSQRDVANNDDNASKYVLQQVNGTATLGGGEDVASRVPEAKPKKVTEGLPDLVDDMGFDNDGYDYKKHLSTMSGGTFISSDGRVQQNNSHVPPTKTVVDLPDEFFQGEEAERDLESITLNTDTLDPEMRAVLDGDEEFDFEEIQDDFVDVAAADDGSGGGFDFNAHIR